MLDRWNLHLFTVLGHRAAGDLDILVGKLACDGTVAEWFGLILFLDQLPDAGLDRLGRQCIFPFPGG